jgi:hypothetical protein
MKNRAFARADPQAPRSAAHPAGIAFGNYMTRSLERPSPAQPVVELPASLRIPQEIQPPPENLCLDLRS